jgi:hypothetical protein
MIDVIFSSISDIDGAFFLGLSENVFIEKVLCNFQMRKDDSISWEWNKKTEEREAMLDKL